MTKTHDICGRMSQTPFATYDPDGSCWRTSEATLFSDSPPFSATFPPWGMTRSGDAFERLMSERPTVASDCSSLLGTLNAHPRTHSPRDVHHGAQLANHVALLPTPITSDQYNASHGRGKQQLREVAALLPTPAASAPNDGETLEQWQARYERHASKAEGATRAVMPLSIAVQLLPTPRTSDANGAGSHGTGGPDLRTAISALTPRQSSDGSVSWVEPPLNLSMTDDD